MQYIIEQSTVAQSSTEAEYMSISAIVNEIKWINIMLSELSINVAKPITIYCDNQSAIQISKDDALHKRTKHIDIKHHFIRNEIKNNFIHIVYKESGEQTVDILKNHYQKRNFTNSETKS